MVIGDSRSVSRAAENGRGSEYRWHKGLRTFIRAFQYRRMREEALLDGSVSGLTS